MSSQSLYLFNGADVIFHCKKNCVCHNKKTVFMWLLSQLGEDGRPNKLVNSNLHL